jgi:ATPase subunit of ABC transporter with duplicated ATPase domains
VARQFIYHMSGLNKSYGTKKVLDNVHLSFYPDAKIGILGPNGAGKSTVLKIMAGLDKEYTGEAWLAEGATVGYLAQEPQLDPNKTVFENVMDGVAKKRPSRALQRADDELLRRDRRRGRQAAGRDRRPEPLGSGTAGRDGDGRAALPARRSDVTSCRVVNAAASRCAACCSQPDLLLLDEPTNHLDAETTAWLEKHLRDYPGAVLIITHDRYFLDNVTAGSSSSIAAAAFPTRATTRLSGAKAKRLSRKAARTRASEGDLARAGMDRIVAQGTSGQVQGAYQGL